MCEYKQEMVYGESAFYLLCEDYYRGIKFEIRNTGSSPETIIFFGKNGISDESAWKLFSEFKFIGNYYCCGRLWRKDKSDMLLFVYHRPQDFIYDYNNKEKNDKNDKHKWTTDELIDHVKTIIDAYFQLQTHGEISSVKPMIYKEKCDKYVLYYGEELGISFSVESLGTHPVAYIYLPKRFYETYYNELDGCVPGGITYEGEEKFGWDYAHYHDFVYGAKKDGKKWTTDEIISDAKEIIKFYVRLREAKEA